MTMPEIAALEARVARVEGIIEEIRTRLAGFENRLGRLEDRLTGLEARMQTQFQWLVGLMLGLLIPMWVSIILAILLRT
jgi:hypothetical protein